MEEIFFIFFVTSTSIMFYLFDTLLFKFLAYQPYQLLVWACPLSSSQLHTHPTLWLHHTGPPQIAQTPSTPLPSSFIVASLVPPMRPSHTAHPATAKAEISPSRVPEKTISTILISTFSKTINQILMVHTAFSHQTSIS